MSRYTITRVVQTCQSCPSQWDAWTDNGQYLYLRYRCGVGTVEEFDSPDVKSWPDKAPEISFVHGDNLAGSISLTEFAELAGLTIATPACS